MMRDRNVHCFVLNYDVIINENALRCTKNALVVFVPVKRTQCILWSEGVFLTFLPCRFNS